jgi:hypothetical protein
LSAAECWKARASVELPTLVLVAADTAIGALTPAEKLAASNAASAMRVDALLIAETTREMSKVGIDLDRIVGSHPPSTGTSVPSKPSPRPGRDIRPGVIEELCS